MIINFIKKIGEVEKDFVKSVFWKYYNINMNNPLKYIINTYTFYEWW